MAEPEGRKVKRQELAPGIFMEKYQEQGPEHLYFIIKIEVKIFMCMEFTVDFEGSQFVRFESGTSLIKKSLIMPFTKTQVSRLILDKNWVLRTKYKFLLKLPPI